MHRRHFLTLSALVLPLLPLVPSSTSRADAIPVGMQNAEIVSIDTAQSVIVLRMRGRERRARFGPLTRVRLNGSPASVTDLRPDMHCYVRFAASETGGEGTMLVAVDARQEVLEEL